MKIDEAVLLERLAGYENFYNSVSIILNHFFQLNNGPQSTDYHHHIIDCVKKLRLDIGRHKASKFFEPGDLLIMSSRGIIIDLFKNEHANREGENDGR